LSSPGNSQFEPQPSANVAPPAVEVLSPDGVSIDPLIPSTSDSVPTPVSSGPPPVENPVFSGWDVLVIFALTVVTMVVSQILVLFGARWVAYPGASLSDLAQKPMLLLLSQFPIYAGAALFMMLVVQGKYHERFWQAIRWNWPPSGWRLLALGGILLFTLNLLQYFLPMPKDTPFEKLFARPRDAYLLSLIAVTLGPLMEELFFRGFLYPVLARRMGVAWGIFLTALPFGLMHMAQYGYAWGAVLVIFLVGVVCTAVRAAMKSVGASFLVHAGYNGTQMVIAAILTDGFRHMDKAGFLVF
jgi:membrane protease YdiL (CAAX protease family)